MQMSRKDIACEAPGLGRDSKGNTWGLGRGKKDRMGSKKLQSWRNERKGERCIGMQAEGNSTAWEAQELGKRRVGNRRQNWKKTAKLEWRNARKQETGKNRNRAERICRWEIMQNKVRNLFLQCKTEIIQNKTRKYLLQRDNRCIYPHPHLLILTVLLPL